MGTALVAFAVLSAGVAYAYMRFGWAPVLIIGVPGIFAWWFWYSTYLQRPSAPDVILPPFLLTAAGFELHAIEEYLGHYGPAVGRLFGFAWTDGAFVVAILVLSGALSLIAVGLHHRKPLAGFVALLFVATRLAEVALFLFPFIPPAIEPDTAGLVSRSVGHTWVADMPNHYHHVVGSYYFPGMYTVALPIIPALYLLYRVWRESPRRGAP